MTHDPSIASSQGNKAVEPEDRRPGLGRGPVELAGAFADLSQILRSYKERVNGTISPRDQMFTGDKDRYLGVGYSAFALITYAMALSGRASVARILDLSCGHGRVLRMLRAAFPSAAIVACDIDRDATAFCARQFGAIPIYSDPQPDRIPIMDKFDLVWCGSLLTHIDSDRARSFVEFLADRLERDGLLVLTTHGRHVLTRGTPGEERWDEIVQGFFAEGYGYRDRTGVVGWGSSITKPSWIIESLSRREDLSVLTYVEREWNDHQDVISVVKSDINHRQGERLFV